jgi:hypothetical protein
MDLERFRSKIITIDGQQVILDSDIADLYDVETKRVNEAVKNNPEKFPEGYIITLTDEEFEALRSKFSTTRFSKSRVVPHAFSERALYMLATILKSPVATGTTLGIIETFAKVRELSRTIGELHKHDQEEQKFLA